MSYSYDLDLRIVPPGYTFEDYVVNELPKSNLSADVQLMQEWAIIRAVQTKLPDFRISPLEAMQLLTQAEHELNGTLTRLLSNFPELQNGDGITIYLDRDRIRIIVPSGFAHDDAVSVFSIIYDCLRAIQELSNYSICDYQLSKIIDLDRDFDAMIAAYLSI